MSPMIIQKEEAVFTYNLFSLIIKILTENALEYLASGKGFYGDRLTGSKSKLES